MLFLDLTTGQVDVKRCDSDIFLFSKEVPGRGYGLVCTVSIFWYSFIQHMRAWHSLHFCVSTLGHATVAIVQEIHESIFVYVKFSFVVGNRLRFLFLFSLCLHWCFTFYYLLRF